MLFGAASLILKIIWLNFYIGKIACATPIKKPMADIVDISF